MINMQHILLVINPYLNLKTYSITFISCLDKIIWRKLNKKWESWKRPKISLMGIAWGKMENEHMGLKHTFTLSEGLDCSVIQHILFLLIGPVENILIFRLLIISKDYMAITGINTISMLHFGAGCKKYLDGFYKFMIQLWWFVDRFNKMLHFSSRAWWLQEL